MRKLLKIDKVAELGTGVMGAQIAAHLTNAKIPVLGFDINQEVAEKGIKDSLNLKPNPYYNPKTIELIISGEIINYKYDTKIEDLVEKNIVNI